MPPNLSRLASVKEICVSPEDFVDEMAEWLEDERPALTTTEIATLCRSVTPRVGQLITTIPQGDQQDGQQVTRDIKWSKDDIRIFNHGADADTQHEDTVADPGSETGQQLYKVCLRLWHRFPTEIICPNAGLVFGSDSDPSIQSKLVEMKWTRRFNDVLTKIVAHNAWAGNFHLMVAAIRFTCICYCDDRRHWKLEAHGDPFLETFLLSQRKNPGVAKQDLLDVISRRLKNRGQWPSKSFQIFKSIASVVSAATHKTSQEEGRENDELGQDSATSEPWHLLTVRTRHLRKLVEALDKTTIDGYPAFHSSATQLMIVTQAQEDGKFNAKDAPVGIKSYVALRKAALKGLRACGLAYKKVWDEEMAIVTDIPQQLRSLAPTDEDDDDLVVVESPSYLCNGTHAIIRGRGNSDQDSTWSRKRRLPIFRRPDVQYTDMDKIRFSRRATDIDGLRAVSINPASHSSVGRRDNPRAESSDNSKQEKQDRCPRPLDEDTDSDDVAIPVLGPNEYRKI
ncbi:hypothetical protein F4803DRAFT_571171 [Xylaria telfairii]|nr:hypothetical protein F4803DRAFT_571171 [Xylaria telfairii]